MTESNKERLERIKEANLSDKEYYSVENLKVETDMDWLIKQVDKVEQLEDDIEKLKPFTTTFNELFGTNLIIDKEER